MVRSKFLHHLFRSGILFGFSYYILFLVKSENILYYIAPRMVDYVKWSAIALYVIAVYQAYLAVVTIWTRKLPDCACEELPPFRFKALLIYSLFAFPLLLGFLMPDTTMGSALAAKKGINMLSADALKSNVKNAGDSAPGQLGENPAPAPNTAPPAGPSSPQDQATANKSGDAASLTEDELNRLFPSDEFTASYARLAKKLYVQDKIVVPDEWYIETISSVDLYLDHFIGKEMELSGFVFRESGMEEDTNQFIIARFALQCCSADAAPWGIMIEYDRAQSLANDSWIKVTGPIGTTKYNDMEILTVKATKIEKIPTPKTAYVYQNPEF